MTRKPENFKRVVFGLGGVQAITFFAILIFRFSPVSVVRIIAYLILSIFLGLCGSLSFWFGLPSPERRPKRHTDA